MTIPKTRVQHSGSSRKRDSTLRKLALSLLTGVLLWLSLGTASAETTVVNRIFCNAPHHFKSVLLEPDPAKASAIASSQIVTGACVLTPKLMEATVYPEVLEEYMSLDGQALHRVYQVVPKTEGDTDYQWFTFDSVPVRGS